MVHWRRHDSRAREAILPVFAGMVPPPVFVVMRLSYSPRIRGDGPLSNAPPAFFAPFSPYSRGWSVEGIPILAEPQHSPRIRGDGPNYKALLEDTLRFSPYSRGWSGLTDAQLELQVILPVFAGMVPVENRDLWVIVDSPRIRGDGPR